MADQMLIQVRVDTQLKEQAAEVFDKIGIDIPTAVRMFFKAVVREQGLPFSTNVAGTAKQTESEADRMTRYIRNKIIYESPVEGDEADCVTLLPLENGMDIPVPMFIQIVTKVPAGKITCWEDIFDFLGKLYDRKVYGLPKRAFPQIDSENRFIPYWRVVSARGVLGDSRWVSREMQKQHLIEEGIPVMQRGSMENSFRVDNYREYMFNFGSLKVIRRDE